MPWLTFSPCLASRQVDDALKSVRKMLELDDKNKAGLALLKELQASK